jgi:hypothetical protein
MRRRGFADYFLYTDILLLVPFIMILALVGLVAILAPVVTFVEMWSGLWEPAAEPPKDVPTLLVVAVYAVSFVLVLLVEWVSGPARLSFDQFMEDLTTSAARLRRIAREEGPDERRKHPLYRRLCWLAGAIAVGTALFFATIPLGRLPLDFHVAMAWIGACNLVLIIAVMLNATYMQSHRLFPCVAAQQRRRFGN